MTQATPKRTKSGPPKILADLLKAQRLEPGRAAWRELGRVVGTLSRGRPYTWRYVLSVHSGTLPMSPQFRAGVQRSLAVMDGSSPILLRSVEISAFALDRAVAGSLIMQSPATCKCGVRFVPNVPWRKNCPGCSPPRKEISNGFRS
jgi:hypothetical protein